MGGSAYILLTGAISEFDRKEIGATRPLPAFQKGQLQPIQFILLSAAGEPWHRTQDGPQDHTAGTGCGLAGRFFFFGKQFIHTAECYALRRLGFVLLSKFSKLKRKTNCSLNRRISTRGWQNGTNEPPVEISQQAEMFKCCFC